MIITTGFTDLSAEAHRNQTAALLSTTSTLDPNGTPFGLQVVGGVHSGFFLTGGASLTGTVQPGRAIIPSTAVEGGAYVVTMTEDEDVTFDPGVPTYTRVDVLVLQIDEVPAPAEPPVEGEPIPDPVYVAGATLKVIKGAGVTGTTTPPRPATPANAIALWAVTIKPNTSSATGFRNGGALDIRARLKLANQDRLPFAMAAGTASVNMTTTRNYGTVGITFPAGRFRVPPICTASLANAPGNSGQLSARVINANPGGATIMVYTGDNGPVGQTYAVLVSWHAVQMQEDFAQSQ